MRTDERRRLRRRRTLLLRRRVPLRVRRVDLMEDFRLRRLLRIRRVLDLRRRRVAFLAFRFIAIYLRRPAGNLPFLRPLRLLRRLAIVFFLLVDFFFFFLKIESKLALYSSSTMPVAIGLLGYSGERGVRTPNEFRRMRRARVDFFRRRLRGFSKRSCFIHYRDELRAD